LGAGVGDKGANDAFRGSGSQAVQRAGGLAGNPSRDPGFRRLIADADAGGTGDVGPPGAGPRRQSSADSGRKYGNVRPKWEDTMIEPKLEVPAELRDLAEKTIDQAEKAFGMFFDAAAKSMASVPNPGSEISKQALSFTEQNMKAAFEHARKLVHATDLQEAMRIQSEFLRSQFTNAGEHMRQMTGGVMSAAKDAAKGKF
jgi:phasin